MTSTGFFAVISQSWRIFKRRTGPLLLIAAPMVLASLPLLVVLAPPAETLAFLLVNFRNSPGRAVRIARVVTTPIARLTILAVAGPIWTLCADISAHKVVTYYDSERAAGEGGQGFTVTRGPFRLVKALKILGTVAAGLTAFKVLVLGLVLTSMYPAEEGKKAEIPSESTINAINLLGAIAASNTLLALPATILDSTGRCWGFASLLRSWDLSRNARVHMVGFLVLTLTGTLICFAVPPFLVAAMGSPAFNSGNLLYLAEAAGLPGIISLPLFVLGTLQKVMALIRGPGLWACAAFVGLVGSTAYFQVLWIVAFLASLRRIEST